MTRIIVMDEFHITVSVSAGLTKEEYRKIRRCLDRLQFHKGLSKAVQQVFARHPVLAKTRIALSR